MASTNYSPLKAARESWTYLLFTASTAASTTGEWRSAWSARRRRSARRLKSGNGRRQLTPSWGEARCARRLKTTGSNSISSRSAVHTTLYRKFWASLLQTNSNTRKFLYTMFISASSCTGSAFITVFFAPSNSSFVKIPSLNRSSSSYTLP